MSGPEAGIALSRRTTLRIGGRAKELLAPDSEAALREALRCLHERGTTPFILGGGSNTLFPDDDFARPIVSTERLRRMEFLPPGNVLRAEAGVRLGTLIQRAIQLGLTGLEALVGIPGTVGGAVRMNAGGNGWNFGDRVRELGLFPLDGGPLVRLKGREVRWGYRSSSLLGFVVAWASLDLNSDSVVDLRRRAGDFLKKKAAAQPLNQPSAGCVFRNPPGDAAAKLIDSLGLKGLSRGGARVSERHANFIVNPDGQARASDVVCLMEEVRSRVLSHFGIRLETEIVLA